MNQLISQNERSRERAVPASYPRDGEGKGKQCRSWTSKGSCSKGSKRPSEYMSSQKGKANDNYQKVKPTEGNSAGKQRARGTRTRREQVIDLRVSTPKVETLTVTVTVIVHSQKK